MVRRNLERSGKSIFTMRFLHPASPNLAEPIHNLRYVNFLKRLINSEIGRVPSGEILFQSSTSEKDVKFNAE